MRNNRAVRGLLVLHLAVCVLAVSAQPGPPSGGATVTARRVADFPADVVVRVVPAPSSDIGPGLLELAESVLREQGVTVADGGRYVLYLQRVGGQSKAAAKPRVGLKVEGGGRRIETAEIQVPITTRANEKHPRDAPVYGLEGSLEGPGGFVYWRVKGLVRASRGDARFGEDRLLRHALETFGLTVVRDIEGSSN